MDIVNIAAYKFVAVTEPELWRTALKSCCDELALKGTILVAPEGLNLFLAGSRGSIDSFLLFLRHEDVFHGAFTDVVIKESLSHAQPFKRMLVRLKKEIITMKHPTIQPEGLRAPSVDPVTLKTWLDQGHDDEGREVVLLDTRNDFEVEIGTFNGAVDLGLQIFSQFPEAIRTASSEDSSPLKDKTIVSFCTGGIRCEKAALFMQELDIPHVLQLEGGILNYFKEVGGEHWRGGCFVFDERRALDPELKVLPLDAAKAEMQ